MAMCREGANPRVGIGMSPGSSNLSGGDERSVCCEDYHIRTAGQFLPFPVLPVCMIAMVMLDGVLLR